MGVASMRGSTIVVSTGRAPSGIFKEGIVKAGETHYPGMICQVDPTVAMVEGVHTMAIYNRDADGDRPAGAYYVCTEILQVEQGKGVDPAVTANGIAAGERAVYYALEPGCEVNLIFKNVSGTADDVTAGAILTVDDGTGKMITGGSGETEPAVALAAVTDPTEDQLVWSQWSGY